MKNIFLYLYLISNIFSFIKAQSLLQPTGDSFWSQVSTMRMEQIIWRNDTLFSARTPMYQDNGGVYRSTDGGHNWDTLYSTSETISGGLRLFLHPTESKTMYLIYGSLYKSTDAGQSWSPLLGGNGPLVRLAINPQDPQIMYATKSVPFGTVYKTTNGGSDWSIAGNGLLQEVYFVAGPIDINPENPEILLLGTNAGLYRSTDSGVSWDTTNIKGYIYNVDIHPRLNNIAFASTDYDWSIYKTTDYGESWYRTSGGKAVNKCIFNFQADSIVYNSGNLKSMNYGDDWSIIDSLSGWTDMANDGKLNTQIYATVGSYGLYTYTDLISLVNQESQPSLNYSMQNYPNPFNSSTLINWQTPVSSRQIIKVYDLLGKEIVTLVDEYKPAGSYEMEFNAANLPSGVYFYQLKAGDFIQTKKMILLK